MNPLQAARPGGREMPSPRFVEVASEIASVLRLDAQMLIDGTPVEANGMRFAFVHHGERDAEGMTLLMQIGVLPQVEQAAALRQLLNFNAMTPAGVSGYYAVVPGTDDVVCGWRFDIATMEDAARQIVATVGEMCRRGSAMRKSLERLLGAVHGSEHEKGHTT